jgi:ADP-dependent phosphofructokinase/glucokinase
VGPLAARAHGLAALDQPVDFEYRRSVANAKVLANLLDRVRLGKVAKKVALKLESGWDRAIFVNLYVPSHARGELNCKHHGLLLFGLGLIGDSLGS